MRNPSLPDPPIPALCFSLGVCHRANPHHGEWSHAIMADERSPNQLTMPPVDAEHASTFTPGAAHFGTPVMAQPGQMIVVSKESSTPKVVGIITIIYGSLSLLTFLIQTAVFSAVPSVREGATQAGFGSTGYWVSMLGSAAGLVMLIIGGYWISERQRRGVQLSMIAIGITVVTAIAGAALGFDGGIADQLEDSGMVSESDAMTISTGVNISMNIICNACCGLFVAWPLMITDAGMDRSSLL